MNSNTVPKVAPIAGDTKKPAPSIDSVERALNAEIRKRVARVIRIGVGTALIALLGVSAASGNHGVMQVTIWAVIALGIGRTCQWINGLVEDVNSAEWPLDYVTYLRLRRRLVRVVVLLAAVFVLISLAIAPDAFAAKDPIDSGLKQMFRWIGSAFAVFCAAKVIHALSQEKVKTFFIWAGVALLATPFVFAPETVQKLGTQLTSTLFGV